MASSEGGSGALWGGRFSQATAAAAARLNSSISVDARLWREDIRGSCAHARMLAQQGILLLEDAAAIESGLLAIAADLEAGNLTIDETAEDIHMFIETELTRRIGEAGKRLHTARSRNDQVATDVRLWLLARHKDIAAALAALIRCLLAIARDHLSTIMPGYTHLQRAQPITLGFHLAAHAHAFLRDLDRLRDASRRGSACPLGAAALAGSGYPLDREMTAAELGFAEVMTNAMDAVSDRDFLLETTGTLALLMIHLSRFAEEIILWSSQEFAFAELADAYSTGSSIMPQKKNPDIAELTRALAARVLSDQQRLFVLLKGLPLAYNKDLQEDKEALFDAVDSVLLVLPPFTGMLESMTWRTERMREAAGLGFTNATDFADYLVGRGIAFRDAHRIVGELVRLASDRGLSLGQLPLETLQAADTRIAQDVYAYIELEACVERRSAATGGPAAAAVSSDIRRMETRLEELLD